MNLVVHQLRCDLRHFHKALLVWLVLLGTDLALNLDWVGVRFYDPVRGLNHGASFWEGWLVSLMWLTLFLVSTLVVLADSPAKTDGFLSTRPMPGRDLYLAKGLFVLLLVLPAVLQEVAHLGLRGLPGRYVAHGALERFLIIAPCAVVSAAFAGFWANIGQWMKGFAATVAGGWGLGIVLMLVAEAIPSGKRVIHEPTFSSLLVLLYALAAALTITAILNHRARWSVRRRGLVLSGLALGSLLILFGVRGDLFPVRPADPAAVKALAAAARFVVSPRGINVSLNNSPRAGADRKVQFSVTPGLEPLPRGDVVRWLSRRSELVGATGRRLVYQPPGRAASIYQWVNNASLEDIQAMAGMMPAGTIFQAGSFTLMTRRATFLGDFPIEGSGIALEEPATVHSELVGRVYRWEKVGELALEPGAALADAVGTWRFLAVAQPRQRMEAELVIAREQRTLLTARDPLTARTPYWPTDQHELVLFHPGKGIAYLQDYYSVAQARLGTHTAYSRFALALQFSKGRAPSDVWEPRELAQARLWIFRKNYLGAFDQRWASAPLRLGDYASARRAHNTINNEQLSTAEFRRRLAALAAPGPGATRLEAGRFLNDALRLVDARRQMLEDQDPLVRQLAALAPTQLPAFLAGLPVVDHWASSALKSALKQGLTEQQKPALIAALPSMPELAEILLARGWQADARKELEALLQTRRALPREALQAAAWFEDPQTYPRLLEEFAAQPTLERYEMLRALPGIAPQLEQTMARLWDEFIPLLSSVDNSAPDGLDVALRHGRRDAIETAYRLLESMAPHQRENAWELLDAFKRNVVGIPREQLHDYQQVAAWLTGHRAADFRFDPVRRRYVLLTSPATRSEKPR